MLRNNVSALLMNALMAFLNEVLSLNAQEYVDTGVERLIR